MIRLIILFRTRDIARYTETLHAQVKQSRSIYSSPGVPRLALWQALRHRQLAQRREHPYSGGQNLRALARTSPPSTRERMTTLSVRSILALRICSIEVKM